MRRRDEIGKLLCLTAIIIALMIILTTTLYAVEDTSTDASTHPSQDELVKENCLKCHSEPGLVKKRDDGLLKVITIDRAKFDASVHGFMDCTACHQEFDSGFHSDPKLDEDVEKEYRRVFSEKSQSSHQALYSCTTCHPSEYTDYRESIHGEALMADGIAEAPFCTDCHGKHYIKSKKDPMSATHPTNSPLVCSGCHTDETLMLRYNIDVGAYKGYFDSYHGKKQELGHTKVPVCTTCHTVHGIKAPLDPESSVYMEAAERTCGQCHPGADASFLLAFTHRPPTLGSAPVVYIVRWIYTWILTIVILGMVGYISLDAIAQIRLRLRARRRGKIR